MRRRRSRTPATSLPPATSQPLRPLPRIDVVEDIKRINDIAMRSSPRKTGMILLGGGGWVGAQDEGSGRRLYRWQDPMRAWRAYA